MSALTFDGPLGRLTAMVMARSNREAEAEAVNELAPDPHHSVLAIGFGPGIGIELLVARLGAGHVAGADPSAAMLAAASHRNRNAVHQGKAELVRATADRLPWSDATFDGVIAVNSVQFWDPFDASVAEVARVLRGDGRLVCLTHDWAIKKVSRTDVDGWAENAAEVCGSHGLVEARYWRARAENGKSVAFTARRDRP